MTKSGKTLTFEDWSYQIKTQFHQLYWVSGKGKSSGNLSKLADQVKYLRSGIYKDTVMSSNLATEYQLRPNICLAISLAPEIFPKDEALKALASVEYYLIEKNSLGVKTLDPEEIAYSPNYERDTDCTNPKVALGFNKHNGPVRTGLRSPSALYPSPSQAAAGNAWAACGTAFERRGVKGLLKGRG